MNGLKIIALAAGSAIAAFVIVGQTMAATSEGVKPVPTSDEATRILFDKTCTGCHVASQVVSHRKTDDQWAETVDRMIGFGARVSDEDYPKLVEFLARNYGTGKSGPAPTATAPAPPSASGGGK